LGVLAAFDISLGDHDLIETLSRSINLQKKLFPDNQDFGLDLEVRQLQRIV